MKIHPSSCASRAAHPDHEEDKKIEVPVKLVVEQKNIIESTGQTMHVAVQPKNMNKHANSAVIFTDSEESIHINFQTTQDKPKTIYVIQPNMYGHSYPPGSEPGGQWVREKTCGPLTLILFIVFWPSICCAPYDEKDVYIAPSGRRYESTRAPYTGMTAL